MLLSIIFNVLESYEVVKKHILHFKKMPLPEGVEVIFVDDGSIPSISDYLVGAEWDFCFVEVGLPSRIKIIETRDFRPWTQGLARNKGASEASGDYMLFSDIDHIITKEIIEYCLEFKGDKMEFTRKWGIFGEQGDIITDAGILVEYGLPIRIKDRVTKPFNIFLLKKDHFNTLGGYEGRYAGHYGGEDVNFANKYRDLLYSRGKAKRSVMCPHSMYVYPDPARDVKQVFHSLRRKKK